MTSVTQTCRDINELTANAKLACQLLFQECFKAGIKDVFITETYRSQERQNYLYAQGRTRSGQVVTWTLNSNHTPRLAWDIAVAPPKGLYDKATIDKVGAIAGKLGIEWGGTWKAPNYDAPHFQVAKNWTMPKGYAIEGIVGVPTKSSEKITFVPNTGSANNQTVEKDEDFMKFSMDTTKDTVRDFLKQSVNKGYFGKQWLESFDKGTLTNGDYQGLVLIAEQKRNEAKK